MYDNLCYYPEQRQKTTQLALYQAYMTFYRRLGIEGYSCWLPIDQQCRQNAVQALSIQQKIALGTFSDLLPAFELGDDIQHILMVYDQLEADQRSPLLAILLNIFGLRHTGNGQYDLARQYYDRAEALYRQIETDQPGSNMDGWLASLLNNRGVLLSETGQYDLAWQDYDRAEALYRQVEADQPGSHMLEWANLLSNRGTLPHQNGQYGLAMQDYDRAEALYRQIETDQSDGLASLLNRRGSLLSETGQYDLAGQDYDRAEALYRQIEADQPGSHMLEWANLLSNRGILLREIRQYDLAWQDYDRAEDLYRQFGAGKPGSPHMVHFAMLLCNRGILHRETGHYSEAKTDWLDALSRMEQLSSYNSTIVGLLVKLSRSFLSLADSAPNDYLPRIVRLIYRYQDQVAGDQSERFEGADWWPWLHHALHEENSSLLLTILSASFARRLQTVLSLNLDESLGDDADLAEWRQLSKRRHLSRLELERLAQQGSTAYSQRLADYQGLMQVLDALRPKLLSSYDLESIALLSTPVLQARLAADEAVVVALSLADFGVEGQETYWLIATAQQIMIVHTPSLDHAASQLTAVMQAQRQQAATYGLRSRQRLAPNQDTVTQTDIISDATIGFNALQLTLQEHWQTVQIQLDLLDIRRAYVVGYGRLCGLPWQGVAPPELDLRQYPGLYALNQSRTPSYPSVATPLVLMGYDAAKEPIRRLYYLPLEMQLIAAIWDAEAVRVIETLAQAPDHSLLLLLGHGDFYENHAYFCAADGDMEQMQLVLHQRKLSMLGASACLLGSVTKINEEPLGFLSLAACRGDVEFSFGAMMLIDDLLATCLSLLFHWEWRASRDPALAMRTALRQLQTGQWPEPAQQLFREHLAAYLPAMLQAMREDERQEDSVLANRIKLRNSHILHHWTRDIDKFDLALAVVNGDCLGNAADAVDTLVRGGVNALCSDKSLFKKSIDQFVRCWIWG